MQLAKNGHSVGTGLQLAAEETVTPRGGQRIFHVEIPDCGLLATRSFQRNDTVLYLQIYNGNSPNQDPSFGLSDLFHELL